MTKLTGQLISFALVGTLGLCSCESHSPRWQISHGTTKSVDWYSAALSASSIKGVGKKATLFLSFEGNSLSQAVKPRRDITTAEKCAAWVAMPCPITAEEKWSGVDMQVSFDDEKPSQMQWVWEKGSPENTVFIDGFTAGGDAGFITAIERHQTLNLGVPCGPYDSSEVKFDVRGLGDALLSAGMKK